jgi:hypothetical protein
MELIAKFEWSGGSYVFEKPSGNEGLVSLSGTPETASWSSEVDPVGSARGDLERAVLRRWHASSTSPAPSVPGRRL